MLEARKILRPLTYGGFDLQNREIIHGARRVSTEIQMGPKGYELERGELIGEEKRRNGLAERRKRIDGVDSRPQVRSVVEALGVPRPERAQLDDDPPIVAQGARFVHAFLQKQLDVVEKESPAILERHKTRRAARREIRRLRKNPRIAQHAPAHED